MTLRARDLVINANSLYASRLCVDDGLRELKRFKLILKNKDEKYEEKKVGYLLVFLVCSPVFGQINSLLFYLTLPCVSKLIQKEALGPFIDQKEYPRPFIDQKEYKDVLQKLGEVSTSF
jgi:hypothetical protein